MTTAKPKQLNIHVAARVGDLKGGEEGFIERIALLVAGTGDVFVSKNARVYAFRGRDNYEYPNIWVKRGHDGRLYTHPLRASREAGNIAVMQAYLYDSQKHHATAEPLYVPNTELDWSIIPYATNEDKDG